MKRAVAIAVTFVVVGCAALSVRTTRVIDSLGENTFEKTTPGAPIVQSMGVGIVDAPALQAHLNSILQELIAASAQPAAGVRVYLAGTYDLWPRAERDGSIFVPLGLVGEISNDDEMAAALAHELAHVLLQHHRADSPGAAYESLLNTTDWVVRRGAPLAEHFAGDDAGVVREIKGTAEDVQRGARYGWMARLAGRKLLEPAYTREQEEEADLLGADLLLAAGFNIAGFYALLGYVEDHEAKTQAKATTADSPVVSALDELAGHDREAAAEKGDLDLVGAGLLLAGSAINSAASGHKRAARRSSTLKAYVRHHYRAPRPRLRAAEWNAALAEPNTAAVLANYAAANEGLTALAKSDLTSAEALALQGVTPPTSHEAFTCLALYEVYQMRGREAEAIAALEPAMKSPDPPIDVYITLSEHYAGNRRAKEALGLLDRADARFDEPASVLPTRIRAYRALGRDADADRTLLRCEQVGDAGIKRACFDAAGQRVGTR